MKVTTVSATIRFSEDSGKGAWKSLELGAEAVVEPEEDWEEEQSRLYAHLTNQFKSLWNKNSVSKANYQEPMPLEALSAQPEHFCQEHDCEFKKFTKDNKVWYAHPMGNNKWCNEQLKPYGNIDTTTSGGKLIFHIFGALAEFERNLIRERTQAGLAAARARGKKGGRPKALAGKQLSIARELYEKGLPIVEICRTLKISEATLHRYIKTGEKDQ